MKRIYISVLSLIMLLLTGCLADKDSTATRSYDYVVSVKDVACTDESGVYELFLGNELTIKPEVVLSNGAKEDDYEYRWLVGKSEIISSSKDLTWQIALPEGYGLEKPVPGVFVIKNKINELEYRAEFKFKVRTGYAPNYIAVYQRSADDIDWTSIQGTNPVSFDKFYNDMSQRVNHKTIPGNFKGALNSKSELAIFTDHAPDYGSCISMIDTDGDQDFSAVLGEIIAPVKGRVYKGSEEMDVKTAVYGKSTVKYILNKNRLHAFNGTSSDLPVFDDNTFVKDKNVLQTISSKQLQQYKKATVVLYEDKTLARWHKYDDDSAPIKAADGSNLTVDEILGMFTEGTGLTSNKPYNIYLVARKGDKYNIYVIYTPTDASTSTAVLKSVIEVPQDVAQSAVTWFGTFSNARKGYYATKNALYMFDYQKYHDLALNPKFEPKPIVTFDSKYEIVDVFVQIKGTGTKDDDDCTVVSLYNKSDNKTTLYVFNTITGEKLVEYTDIIPGKVVHLYKKP